MFVENFSVNHMIESFKTKYPHLKEKNGSVEIYTDLNDEYNALVHGVGIYIRNNTAVVELIGKETLEFIHRISTNSVKDLKPFEKVNTLFLNEKGRFIDRTTLLNLDEKYLLVGSRNGRNKLFSWVNKYIIMEDIKTSDGTQKYFFFDLIGSQAESFLTLILDGEVKLLSGQTVIISSAEGFNFGVYCQRFNKLNYYTIFLKREQAEKFIDFIFDNKSVFDLYLAGEAAFNMFRIENYWPVFPNEINDQFNPHEVDLINEVSFTKGCYIGQEVIARLDTYDKVQRKMVGFSLPENLSIESGTEILDGSDEVVGLLTSYTNSIKYKSGIGLGLVRKKIADEQRYFIKTDGSRIELALRNNQPK